MKCVAFWAIVFLAGCNAPLPIPSGPNVPVGAARPEYVFETGFESDDWCADFAPFAVPLNARPTTLNVSPDSSAPAGRALNVTLRKGGHYGIYHLAYYFGWHHGEEPEEIYFRYYLRLASDFDPADTGKLPGFGGTYLRAGFGGIPSDGRNGWSARGLFGPLNTDGRIPIGSYVYHADMPGLYGDSWYWDVDGGGLERNRWYCIEQFVRMNTPGQNDGTLRAWVDDSQVFERTDLRFRDTPELKIEKVWLDAYYGGKVTAARDHTLYFDEMVISREQIGMRK
ncbi:MAG: hypothetical protein IPK83_23105 [Planctomycetes bacterium]|nr:hypothetical protein [Planctomycetota bacterium]